jgi:hypothetical protein
MSCTDQDDDEISGWSAFAGVLVAMLACVWLDECMNDREAVFARDHERPAEVEILKNALSPTQKARYARCEATSPCGDVRPIRTRLRCQNTYMRGCMFQTPEAQE